MSPKIQTIPLNTEREIAVRIDPSSMAIMLLARQCGEPDYSTSMTLRPEELRNLGYELMRQPGGYLLLAAIQSGCHDAR